MALFLRSMLGSTKEKAAWLLGMDMPMLSEVIQLPFNHQTSQICYCAQTGQCAHVSCLVGLPSLIHHALLSSTRISTFL